MAKPDISAEELRKVIRYEPSSGLFFWLVHGGRRNAGDIAGCTNGDGYICIGVAKKLYVAHRLAFLYMTGSFPKEQADHINGKRTDNRWENLRECSIKLNTQNRRNAPVTNKSSGILGVTFEPKSRNPWRARIKVDGKKLHLGTFETKEAAQAAYIAAKRLHHPGSTL